MPEKKFKIKPLPPPNPPKHKDPAKRVEAIRRATGGLKELKMFDSVREIREIRGKL